MNNGTKRNTSSICFALLLTACHDARVAFETKTDKADAFANIETSILGNGTPRAQVIALMGYPASSATKGFGGIEGEVLVFNDSRKRTYEIVLVNAKAVAKSSSPQPSTTNPDKKGN